MAMAVRGVRAAAPRIGRSILALNAASFNEQEVDEGEALIDAHFQPVLHPDRQINDKIHRMAKLYVQQHGTELLDFMRQTDLLENQENQENEEIRGSDESADEVSGKENSWSISSLLQWVWSRIRLQNTDQPEQGEVIEVEEDEQEPETQGNTSPNLLQSTVALAMLLTVAVMLTKVSSR